MKTETKIFYASQSLIPAITESLTLQLEQNYKVKVANLLNSTEITVTKYDFLAWAGGKILKTITLSGAPNGQIICKVSGIGFGGILVPFVAMCFLDVCTLFVPNLFFVSGLMTWIIIGGLFLKSKLTKEIFELTKEAIEANKNIPETQNIEKKCPNCGMACKDAVFCPECGTRIQ